MLNFPSTLCLVSCWWLLEEPLEVTAGFYIYIFVLYLFIFVLYIHFMYFYKTYIKSIVICIYIFFVSNI